MAIEWIKRLLCFHKYELWYEESRELTFSKNNGELVCRETIIYKAFKCKSCGHFKFYDSSDMKLYKELMKGNEKENKEVMREAKKLFEFSAKINKPNKDTK